MEEYSQEFNKYNFCSHCGDILLKYPKIIMYDTKNGEPIIRTIVKCINYKWYSDIINNHDQYELDEYGEKFFDHSYYYEGR